MENFNGEAGARRSRGRPKTDNPRGIQSTTASLDVLKAMLESDRPMHLSEISARVQREASTVYRYLVSFVAGDLVTQDESGRYDLGPMAVQLGLAALRRLDGLPLACQELGRLVKEVHADGHVTVWGTFGPTVVRALSRPIDVVVRVQEGWVMPVVSSATGRTWASFLPKDRVEPAVHREFETDPASRSRLNTKFEKECAAIRQRGYAFASGERRVLVNALCAPIFDRHGTMVYAITLVAEEPALSPDRHPDVLRQLLDAASRVSRSLGAPDDMAARQGVSG